jgi:hypothetical protein
MLFAANSHAALVSVSGQGKIVSPKSVQEDYPTKNKIKQSRHDKAACR